ncbi:hypothetical protein DFR29_11770 [Tahibacter aquaticus]|uniref:Uncharacterized protein n=1 Tax=Tahibacter aquaticus TaxID=520092 RepID=A0A4R6YNL7_9GAMM|nr:hypothetical protein [Tahibacter aquaticus]TDR39165.1 hypothetical protein DFR29_11770 [Tahibacter aquaticus]
MELLDADRNNGSDKYGLAQSDFYQLHAYGQTYLQGRGDVARVYPLAARFPQPLPAFRFPHSAASVGLAVLPGFQNAAAAR